MEIFDSRGWKWKQQPDGSWWRWDGSGWRQPDAQHAPPPTPGMVGTNQNEYSDNRGFRWSIDANGQHWRWNGSAWIASDASPDYAPPAASTPSPTPTPTPEPTPTAYAPPASPPTSGWGGEYAPLYDWNNHPAGSRSWRYLTPELQQYYEQNPDEAFRQYTTAEFGGRDTPLLDYARSHYQDYWAQYTKASEGDPTGGPGWTNSLTDDLAGQIRNSFQLQSPGQKGYQLSWQPAGRFTG